MSGRRLAVVAGAGALPGAVVGAALRAGDAVLVLSLAPQQLDVDVEVVPVQLADLPALIALVRNYRATHLVLAGSVVLSEHQRRGIASALGAPGERTGDIALSHLGTRLHQLTGATLIGVHELAPHLLAQSGHVAGPPVPQALLSVARFALGTAREVGRIDLGQAAVVTATRVLAAEDVAGTDDLLRRVGRYRDIGAIDAETVVVLGKASKPQQPLFVDLPAIGPDTVINAAAAGIRLIALEARNTLLLDLVDIRDQADRLGVTIVALDD